MAETDFERERRSLRELEGKNIANYKVILTALIRTTMENVRTVVTLSAAGIGLVVIIMVLGWIQGGLQVLSGAGAFAGFFISLVLSLGVLERNAQYLTRSLKDGSEKSLDLESCSQGARRLFLFGCLCLIVVGLLSAGTKARKMRSPHMKCFSSEEKIKTQESASADDLISDTKVATKNDNAVKMSQPASAAGSSSQDVVKPTTSTSMTSSTTGTQETAKAASVVSKSAGNAGNFKGGKTY